MFAARRLPHLVLPPRPRPRQGTRREGV